MTVCAPNASKGSRGWLLGAVALCACHGTEAGAGAQHAEGADAPGAASPYPNILVIAPDTLRADRLLAERDGAPLMPNLAGVARKGVNFSLAISNGGWTMPALASFLGGTWPLVPSTEGGASLSWLRSDVPRLPEVLVAHGYATAVFWGSTMTTYAPEFSVGFQKVDTTFFGATDPGDAPAAWLHGRPREPFFALVHDVDLQFLRPADGAGAWGRGVEINERFADHLASMPAAAATDATIADYDTTARRFDASMAPVLRALDDEGYAARTLVVVTSNHGLSLGSVGTMMPEPGTSGGFLHGTHLDSSLRIPLAIHDPRPATGMAPGTRDALVQTIDIAPTLLGLAGITRAAHFTGTDLSPLLRDPAATLPDREVYSVSSSRNMSVRTRTRKLVRRLVPVGAPGTPTPKLQLMTEYLDLVADPDETRMQPPDAVSRELGSKLETFARARLSDKAPGTPHDDAALREALKRDGYWSKVEP